MQWLAEHSQAVSALVGVGTLLVWVVYLEVFLRSYRRQKKATILINLSGGAGLEARCLVTNMSAAPIYIYAITLTLHGAGQTIRCPVTELDGVETWETPSDIKLWTRQGPLDTGQVRDMGTIEALVAHVRHRREANGATAPEKIDWIEFEVAAVFASEDLLVAACRCYDVAQSENGPALHARTIGATQIRSRRRRRRTEAALQREIDVMH